MGRSVLSLLLLVVAILAAALSTVHSAKISHDAVAVWPQPAAANAAQQLAVRFKPFFSVNSGCQPYPAVDAAGNTGGGLQPTGSSSAGCSDRSKAQVYSRSGYYRGFYAIMYAWYMPKDSPSSLLGHRHDWENAVVWLDNPASANIVAISASAHGKYKVSYPVDRRYLHGVNMKISYKATWPLNHELGFTSTVGAQQPLIQWEQMTPAAQNALEATDFGAAMVPFKAIFERKLGDAFFL